MCRGADFESQHLQVREGVFVVEPHPSADLGQRLVEIVLEDVGSGGFHVEDGSG